MFNFFYPSGTSGTEEPPELDPPEPEPEPPELEPPEPEPPELEPPELELPELEVPEFALLDEWWVVELDPLDPLELVDAVVAFVALVTLVVLLAVMFVVFWSIDPLVINAAAPIPTSRIMIANTNIIKFSVFIVILNPI